MQVTLFSAVKRPCRKS